MSLDVEISPLRAFDSHFDDLRTYRVMSESSHSGAQEAVVEEAKTVFRDYRMAQVMGLARDLSIVGDIRTMEQVTELSTRSHVVVVVMVL